MLTNTVLAGAFGAAYLTVLVLQLNPHMPIVSASTWRWFYTLCLFYGVHLAVLFYVIIVLREFFSVSVLSPGWVSVRMLAWMGAVAAAVAAVLMWVNVNGLALALGEATVRRMTTGAIAATVSAAVLLGIAIAHYSFGRRGSRVGAALFLLAAFGSLALPIAARGPAVDPAPPLPAVVRATTGEIRAGPRVTLILLDGASLDYIWPRVAEGRLPNFAKLLDKGATIDLATFRPTQPDPVWAAAATGMYPSKNGVRSAGVYYARSDTLGLDLLPQRSLSHALVQLGFVRDEPKSSSAWRARPIWTILSQAGIPVGIVRWPLTHPAEPVNGFLVSDRFDQFTQSIFEFERALYPTSHLPAVMEAVASLSAGGHDVSSASPVDSALRRDRLYAAATRQLKTHAAPRVIAIRYQGLDTVGHYYFRYTQAGTITAVTEAERRRFLQIVDRQYQFIDDQIGQELAELTGDDLLMVVSGFGMASLNPVKQWVGRVLSGQDWSGTHENAPDGFLLAYGAAVDPGRHDRGSIVDVTPTLLYFLGLPIGRDMDGYARADLFTDAFTAERPIDFIPSYSR